MITYITFIDTLLINQNLTIEEMKKKKLLRHKQ